MRGGDVENLHPMPQEVGEPELQNTLRKSKRANRGTCVVCWEGWRTNTPPPLERGHDDNEGGRDHEGGQPSDRRVGTGVRPGQAQPLAFSVRGCAGA